MKNKAPAWAILLICWLALLCDGYDLYVYGATLPGFLADSSWNVTKAFAGAVGSFSLIGMLIGSLTAGTLTDRLGRRKLMLTSLAIFTIGMLLCAFAPSFVLFAVFRFVTCLGVGGLLPTAVAVASESAPNNKRSLAVGAVLLGPPVGSLIGALTAGALVADHGVRPVYAIGTASAIVFVLVLLFLPETRAFKTTAESDDRRIGVADTASPATSNKVRSLFVNGHLKATLLSWAACLISLLVITGITTWLPVIMQDAGFATGSSIGFLSIYSVGCIVGTIVLALGAQRWAPKYMVVFGFATAAVALAGVSIAHSHTLLFAAVFLAGVGGMATQNMINDHVAQYYPAGIRATGLGWTLGIGRIGMIVGPVYGSFAVTIGGTPAAAALWFAIPACVGVVIALSFPRKKTAVAPAAPIAVASGLE